MTTGMATAGIGLTARLSDLTEQQLSRLLERSGGVTGTKATTDATVNAAADPGIETAVRQVIAEVRANGDEALLDLSKRFDKSVPTALEVPSEACESALRQLDPELKAALKTAAANVRTFHEAQLPPLLELEVRPGVLVGRRPEPLGSVGVYVPGGRASYPSSVLMGVIPAKAAGVAEVVVCTPPGESGWPPAPVLAACALAGADRVFAVGGAGAIAALALGTTSVPRVSKVVGPGNAYVTEAKRQLNGLVAIDCPAGPSEVLVVADDTADPELVALELVAQAEHDPLAAAVLVGVGEDVATSVWSALTRQLDNTPRAEIVRESLNRAGALLTARTVGEALDFSNRYAPEHLMLMVRQPRQALQDVRNAGSIFLGASSSVVFGDYVTGANHTLPTGGLARAYSGLSTLDFVRFVTYQEVSASAATELAPVAALLANSEGLYSHAAAASARAEGSWAEASVPASHPPSPVQLRRAYSNIELYDPGRSRIGVDLSDNTNLFGLHPSVAQALGNVRSEQVSRYPAVYANTLKNEIAGLHGVDPENVSTGGGLDGVIDAAVRAFCEPGTKIAYPDPTFGMVSLFAQMNGVEPVPTPLLDDLDIDVDALVSTRAALTYVCNPNNPTGKPVNAGSLAGLVGRASGVVLIDEAYADFAGGGSEGSATGLKASARASARLGADPLSGTVGSPVPPSNTLRLRTLSKAYGLAGLRVGYAIGPAELVREVEKSRGPYKVTSSAEAVAVALLRTGKAWVADVVERTVQNRERLTEELRARGLNPLPSAANFVLLPLGLQEPRSENPAKVLGTALKTRGVAVRVFTDLPKIGPAIRITVGPWKMMERFLAEFDAVRSRAASEAR